MSKPRRPGRKRKERSARSSKRREPSEAEKRREALKARQQQRRDELDHKRIDLVGRHMSERDGLKAAQQAQNTGIVSARLQNQPKGFMAFLTRITGIKLIAEARQKQQDKARAAEHKQQTEALKRTHDRELHDMDRRYRALDRLEARENMSAETGAQARGIPASCAETAGARSQAGIRPRRAAALPPAHRHRRKETMQPANRAAGRFRARDIRQNPTSGDTGESAPAPAKIRTRRATPSMNGASASLVPAPSGTRTAEI